jgi:hypothetical protein
MKFCKDCKYSRYNNGYECKLMPDLSGDGYEHWVMARAEGADCGSEGKLFEEKEPIIKFRLFRWILWRLGL